MNDGPTTVLIVDDSALYRQSIQNVLRDMADVSIVGIARNGVEALQRIEELDPDLLTLDVHMPDMDGIQVLNEIRRRKLRPKAIMVSSLTSQGAQVTTEALMEGAFDFILKPSGRDSESNRQCLQRALAAKIGEFRESCGRRLRRLRRPAGKPPVTGRNLAEATPVPQAACEAVLIGTSTGGPEALKIVLPKLTFQLSVPVLVVQHMPAQYTASLARRLNEICELDVLEATAGLEVTAGMVLIAPGGKQMKLVGHARRLTVMLSDDPPENAVRPSVDYLLRSAADTLDGNALAVIMTGMGRDGLLGCRNLKHAGGYVFAQGQDDCVVYGMPKAVIDEQLADRVLPLGKIAPAIMRHVKRSRRSPKETP